MGHGYPEDLGRYGGFLMIKIKAELKDPVKVAKDWRLSGESVRVFVLLYDHRDTEFLSTTHLAETLGVSMSTLYRALAGLKNLGYLEEKRDREGRTLILRSESLVSNRR